MNTLDIANDAQNLYKTHRSMREPVARDVAEILTTAFMLADDDDGKYDACYRILSFCNELAKLDLVFAGAVVNVVARHQMVIAWLVRTARREKSNPAIGPFLTTLNSILFHGNEEEADALLRDAEIKAAMWLGDSIDQVETILKHYGLSV